MTTNTIKSALVLFALALAGCGGAADDSRSPGPSAQPAAVTVTLTAATLQDPLVGSWTVVLSSPSGAVSAPCSVAECTPSLTLEVTESDLKAGLVSCHVDYAPWGDAPADFPLQPAEPLTGEHVDSHRAIEFAYNVQ